MTRFRACVVAAAVAAVLLVTWLLTDRPARPAPLPVAGPTAVGPTPSPTPSSPGPSPGGPTEAPGPPAGTVAVAASYVGHYRARRVTWDDVLAQGHPLPRPDARCVSRWRASGRDDRISWEHARYWCLNDLAGRHWKPQGVAGTGTTQGYRVGGQQAGRRDLVLTSWYSRAREPGLFAPNRPGQSVTRLVVIDLDRGRYGIVELVQPQGRYRLRNLDSHGSGLAWAGQYLYSSSHSWLWMYNADDLLQVRGHVVLPAVRRWSVSGPGGLSSISLDRSSGRDELLGINYSRRGPTLVHALPLDRRGLLAGEAQKPGSLRLTPVLGAGQPMVSTSAQTVPGTHYQGVARWRDRLFATSSSLSVRPGEPGSDALTVLRKGATSSPVRMPAGNVESIYVDGRRRTFTSLTEAGACFLFVLPLADVVAAAP